MGCNDVEINALSSGHMDLQSLVGAMLACLHQRPSLFFVSIVHMQQCKIMSKSIKEGFLWLDASLRKGHSKAISQ